MIKFIFRVLFFLTFSTSVLFGQSFIISDNNELKEKLNSYLQKSDSCKVKFDYIKALNYISKVHTFSKEYKDINVEILCNIKLIELYRHATLYKKSTFYLHKAENLINKNKGKVSDFNLMYFYNRKASLFSEYFHKLDSTLLYSKKALALSEKTKNQDFKFTSLMEIGFFYEESKDFQTAIAYYQKAFDLAQKLNKKSESCDALVNLSRVYEKNKSYEKALEKCDEGLLILDNNDNFFQKLLFYDIKQNVYENIGDKVAAYDNLKKRLKYTDLYYENNAKNELLEEITKTEILEKDKEILQKKKDIDVVKRNQLLLMTIILFFVLSLIFLLYYSKKVKIINKQLDEYAKQNALLLSEANHRINNNLQLIIILLSEELDKTTTDKTENIAIRKILAKVESISTLHRHLYQHKVQKTVNINQYLHAIAQNFSDIFEEKEISTNLEIEKINLSIDLVMYLGLMVTELFINSVKYAYAETQQKQINLKVYSNNNQLLLEYADNGQNAIGKTVEPKLIIKILKQVKANFTIDTKSGFTIYISKEIQAINEE